MYETETYLPPIEKLKIKAGFRRGRNVAEGYQRGWGLQFGSLREKILSDSLYRDALAVAFDRTIMAEANRMNIFLIMRFFLGKIPHGHIIEYGSFRGGNAIFMAYVAKHLYPDMKVYALDTFGGMPKTDKDIDAHNEGDFSESDVESLKERINELGLSNLIIIKGLFEKTSDHVFANHMPISLAHIDCDIASAVRFSYNAVRPHLVEGSYIIFDDALVSSCIGATEAVEDLVIRRDALNSEQAWPHFVFRLISNL
jgi:predicted O-methyltransferase YrrM